MSSRVCEQCGVLIHDCHCNRRFCDACRKAKRQALEAIRSKDPERKKRKLEAVKRRYWRNREAILARQRERPDYKVRKKIRKAAAEEAAERGLPLETVLQQWGAL